MIAAGGDFSAPPVYHRAATNLLGLSSASGAAVARIARRYFPPRREPPLAGATSDGAGPATISVAKDEKIYWVGTARNPLLLWLGPAGLVVLGLRPYLWGNARGGWLVALGGLTASLLAVLLARVRVTLNETAVVVHYGLFGWPRKRLDLKTILHAEAFDLDPRAHGGWGYRGSLWLTHEAALVVRKGPALRLHLGGGRHPASFSVTVDDADTAAALIDGLMARSRGAAPPEDEGRRE